MNRFSPRLIPVAFLFAATASFAQFGDPFTVKARLDAQNDPAVIRLDVTVPANHYLYAEGLNVTDDTGVAQEAIALPASEPVSDPSTGKPKPVYKKSFQAVYAWKPSPAGASAFHVHYWGCNDSVCFIPQTMTVQVAPPSAAAEPSAAPAPAARSGPAAAWTAELDHYRILGSAAGYMKADPFLRFLDQAETGGPASGSSGFRLFLTDPVAFVRESGLLLTILFILIGGLALNLTPCVLPMIPINLAIIGAGAQAGSKRRGFALGSAYGLGIAIVYGGLGALIVVTGSRFGTIQANPWFNLVIALLFAALALAMFDVFHIDLSRFQSKLGGAPAQKRGSYLVALAMGAVSALLAGACVAPVVIAVLLLATSLGPAGLILPFVLGFGMALPWPFAGAGLSFLPKPGRWMEFVKWGFGLGIIFFAFYYGHLSYRAFRPADITAAGEVEGHLIVDGSTNRGLAEALARGRAEGKPVLIDFWASWCKNCVVMDKTTFRDEAVKDRLLGYTFIKYIAEDYVDPETKDVMNRFGVQGLPTFVVIDPAP